MCQRQAVGIAAPHATAARAAHARPREDRSSHPDGRVRPSVVHLRPTSRSGGPDSSPIPDVAPPLSGNLEDLAERHARIDHRTLTPDWYGDRLDPDPILDALLPKRIKAVAA
ncbi:hypothetical protein GCM10009559_48080 [Pseudonocardia zijingensis]|uniref:Uncharacterized protein n=1 Tax=Pseudonocardia zijingensis TaxID=153376 RepID=A0ABP4BC34_9PSEU